MTTRLVLILGAITVLAGGSWAATITVDTIDPGIAADGWCTLAEAIDNANADAAIHADCVAGSGADVLELGVGLTYTLVAAHTPSKGLPEITSRITVNGHGSTVVRDLAAPEPFRIVSVGATGDLTLNDLTVSGGSLPLGPGGGIYNLGDLTLNRCTVTENESNDCGGVDNSGGTAVMTDSVVSNNTALSSYGGGLCNRAYSADATMTVTRTQILGNSAHGDGGGGIVTVAGSGRSASLTLTLCTVSDNTAPSVPGILQNLFGSTTNAHSTMLIDRCVISRNIAKSNTALGAGVLSIGDEDLETVAEIRDTVIEDNEGAVGAGVEAWRRAQMTITGSTIRHNTALEAGGGILVGYLAHLQLERSAVVANEVVGGTTLLWAGGIGVVDGTATIVNSTVSSNSAGMAAGGVGAFSSDDYGGSGATVEIFDSTITDNTASDIGGGGGIDAARGSGTGVVEVIVGNSVVAANHEGVGGTLLGNCFIDPPASLIDDGYNLTDDTTCALAGIVPDVMLAPLGDCGPTPCHLPLPGSPIIDSGDDGNCPATDQLGQLRPWDGDGDDVAHCDVGAVELWAPFFVDDFEDGTTNAWSFKLP